MGVGFTFSASERAKIMDVQRKIEDNAPTGSTHYKLWIGMPAWTDDLRFVTPYEVTYRMIDEGDDLSIQGWKPLTAAQFLADRSRQ